MSWVRFSSARLSGIGEVVTESPRLTVKILSCPDDLRKVGSTRVIDTRTCNVQRLTSEEVGELFESVAAERSRRLPNTLTARRETVAQRMAPKLLQRVASAQRAPELVRYHPHKFAHVGMDLFTERKPALNGHRKPLWVLHSESMEGSQPVQWLCRLGEDELTVASSQLNGMQRTAYDNLDQIQPMSWVNNQPAPDPLQTMTLEQDAPPQEAPQGEGEDATSVADLIFSIDPNDVKSINVHDGEMVIKFYTPDEVKTVEAPPVVAPPPTAEQQMAQQTPMQPQRNVPVNPGMVGAPTQVPASGVNF